MNNKELVILTFFDKELNRLIRVVVKVKADDIHARVCGVIELFGLEELHEKAVREFWREKLRDTQVDPEWQLVEVIRDNFLTYMDLSDEDNKGN